MNGCRREIGGKLSQAISRFELANLIWEGQIRLAIEDTQRPPRNTANSLCIPEARWCGGEGAHAGVFMGYRVMLFDEPNDV